MAAPSTGVGAGLRRHLTGRLSLCSQCLFLRSGTPPPLRAPARWQSTTPSTATSSSVPASSPAAAVAAAATVNAAAAAAATAPSPSPTPPQAPATGAPPSLSQPSNPASAPPSTGPPPGPPPTPTKKPTNLTPFPDHEPHVHLLRASIILTRPPLLTRKLTPFEEAFYFYQKRLNERLSMHFVTDVYFKKKSPARTDYLLKLRDRKGVVPRELGHYRGRVGGDQWKDELTVGDPLSKSENIADVLARDAVMRVSEDAELIPVEERAPPELPLPRETLSDTKNYVRNLDRALDRTLYLLVQHADGRWEFPTSLLRSDEALHEAAQRTLTETAGVNMNTWLVGHAPVAHIVRPAVLGDNGAVHKPASKTFFMKGRIMAGQVNLAKNPLGYVLFKWLTREEVCDHLPRYLFRAVEGMMPAR